MVTRAIPARRLPLLLELCLFQNAHPVATSGPDLPLLCSALPARLPAVPLFLWSSCLPACLALCWQLAVAGRGVMEELEGQPAWACIIRPGWAREPASPLETNHLAHRPSQPSSAVCFS